jgi:uridine kinase
MILVGIAGGTGSGKTTVAQKISQALHGDLVLIEQDSYYKDYPGLSLDERARMNYDHPDAIDFDLMKEHLIALKSGLPIEKPIYNFQLHRREPNTCRVMPSKVIMVEGILLFAIPEVRDLIDLKIFVDTDDDIRLLRRVERDIVERARDLPGIKKQYLETVKPMHLEFVEPSKRYADIIIPRGGENETAINLVASKLKFVLAQQRNESR